ncbi:DUF1127 domain-containing protein [Celeribacter sp. HF31]|nr:DUF1127 domain-containing protein [Celeribacter sp. HF31]
MSSSIFAPTSAGARGTACDRPSRSAFGRLRSALALSKQRRTLASLDDAILKDIGLTREEALKESQRPVWDAPRNWMR